ncbi:MULTISPECIES: MarC family protein [unclassified Porphyromonas]|uniref:MarC family protein n=1 Tax=unclassified Porphyromonas TaxID=2645799 RepID=UPI00052DF842|nr:MULTISPECIES: MarC family protein [unclassified Porphyromonas]KGN83691.1 membrane protein [Porphyromonas sp. COT-290 OH860]KGO01153.1 membrane protein [Porphyromonas sp. COT-290 OH3588]
MSFFSNITHELSLFSISEIIKAFAPLFVTIDILGAIPIVLSLKDRGQKFSAAQVGIYSCLVLLCFLIIGEPLLDKLGVDISSFGVAGGIILFVMAAEMVFGIQIFREDGPTANATFIPLVFPLFAGAAAFTTILTLQGQGIAMINVAMSVILNMIVVYLGLRFVDPIERMLGKNGAYILRKFFGVILLAISVKFIANSLIAVIATVRTGVEAAMQ